MREVRLVAPSLSLKDEDKAKIKDAKKYFAKLGYELTLGVFVFERDELFGCASIKNRVRDLMDAFLDRNVDLILCADGGYNVNQLLPYLDYDLIKKNPKIVLGYSDITALLLAIFNKTGMVTYYGPMLDGFSSNDKYTISYFEKVLKEKSFLIDNSSEVIDFVRKNKVKKLVQYKNKGMRIINEGYGEGRIIGGNLCTLNLLQGTEFMPALKNCILFIEDDAEDFLDDVFLLEFDRNLESLLQLPDCCIRGIVFGRFQLCSNMTIDKLKSVIKNKKKLQNIPIVCNADFGHTMPMMTIPLGGYCKLKLENEKISIRVTVNK